MENEEYILTEEEEKMINYNEMGTGKYIYMPKIGESIEVKIKEVKKVEGGNDKFNFKQKEKVALPDGTIATIDKSLGYHIEAELEDGKILSVTSLAAFLQVFKQYQINDGDEVKITHKDKGIWEVNKNV